MMKQIVQICLIFSILFSCAYAESDTKKIDYENNSKYVLYIGTEISPDDESNAFDELCKTADTIVLKHLDGFTAQDALGSWKDSDGKMHYEKSIVYIIYYASDEQITTLAEELREELKQKSILIEKGSALTKFVIYDK